MDSAFTPLDLMADEIRLVQFTERQTAPFPQISCIVQRTPLAQALPFKALSYTRCDSPVTATKDISINNHTLRIHLSLHILLEHIQDQEVEHDAGEAWYWISELCTDATNVAEKSHHARLMDQILRRATEVLIWLGPAAETSNSAMQAIEKISASTVHGNAVLDGGSPQKTTDALRELFGLNYWRSAWSVSAVVLARRIGVLCGRRRLEWGALNEFFVHPVWSELRAALGRMFYTKTRRYSKRSMARFLGAKRVLGLVDARYRFSRECRLDLDMDRLVGSYSEVECDDPRDRVYALLGLLPEEDRIDVDYAKPLEEVVFDVFQGLRKPVSGGDLDWDCDMFKLSRLTFDMNVRQTIFHQKPLLEWWSPGSEEDAIKTLLLNDQFDPNWEDTEGDTMLMWAARWRGDILVKLLLATERVNICGSPEVIARYCGTEAMALLLDRREPEDPITNVLVEAALMNKKHAVEIVTLLLSQQDSDLSITEAIVEAAATNRQSGSEAMVVLLSRLSPDIPLFETTLETFIRNFDDKVMEALVAGRDDTIAVTETVIEAATANRKSGSRILEILLSRQQVDIVLTGEMVETIARNFSGKAMEIIFDLFGAATLVTETVLSAAARNQIKGHEVMSSILGHQQAGIAVTEAVVEAVTGNSGYGSKVVKVLLRQPGVEIVITGAVVKAAARNKGGGTKVMKLLGSREGAGVAFTEEAEVAMARHFRWVRRPYH